MPQNAFFLWTRDLLVSQKTMQRHFFSTLHPLSTVIFATATVLAFVLLHDSRFNFHCYTQREAEIYSEIGPEVRCDLLRLLTKRIHSSKPASPNRPIAYFPALEQTHCVLVTCDSDCEWLSSFMVRFECLLSGVQTELFGFTWLIPPETVAVLVHILCTPYNHAPVYGITSFEATCVALGACVFSCNLLPPALCRMTGIFCVLLQ